MSKKRVSVGILITPSDADIAAYLNDLKDHRQKIATHLSALLVANETNQKIVLPDFKNTIFQQKEEPKMQQNGLLFGSGSATQDANKKWQYGWQVRGNRGEYIEGSVVSVSFTRPEIVLIIQKMQENHLKISTYLKALIRHYMSDSSEEQSITTNREITRLLQDYYLLQGKTGIEKETTITTEKKLLPEIVDSFQEDPEISFDKNPLLGYI